MRTCLACNQPLHYTVKPGDTLSGIAKKLYPNGLVSWQQIFALNRKQIKNPNIIMVGQRLMLP